MDPQSESLSACVFRRMPLCYSASLRKALLISHQMHRELFFSQIDHLNHFAGLSVKTETSRFVD